MIPPLKDRLHLSEDDYAAAEDNRSAAMERLIERADILRDERRDAMAEERPSDGAGRSTSKHRIEMKAPKQPTGFRRHPRLVVPLPSDDTEASVKARMKAVVKGHYEAMPGLAEMTEKEMRETLQKLWTLCDECGVQRRNSEGPHSTELVLYGRVYGAIKHGPIILPNETSAGTDAGSASPIHSQPQ